MAAGNDLFVLVRTFLVPFLVAVGCGGGDGEEERRTPDAPAEPPRLAAGAAEDGGADAGRSSDGGDAELLRLGMVEVLDRQGFGKPVVALRFLAPADWELEGGVTWNPRWRCLGEMVQVSVRVRSPDGGRAFEVFPVFLAEWSDDPWERETKARILAQGGQQCPLMPPFDAAGFLREVLVPGFRRGARFETVEPDAETARLQQEEVRRDMASIPGAGDTMQVRADAARARVRWTTPGGLDCEEWLVATTYTTTTRSLSPSAAAQGRMAYQNTYSTWAENVFGFRAPAGELEGEEALFETMLASVQVNPAWAEAVSRVTLAIGSAAVRGAAERAEIWRRASQEAADVQMQSWLESQRVHDEIATTWSRTIRGVALYADPGTGATVELTDGYRAAWSNGGDEFLLSTDPGFDPNAELEAGDWRRLERRE